MILTMLGAGVGTPLFSQNLTVCLQGRTDLDADTMKVFGDELKAIARTSGLTLHIVSKTGECKDIRLSIKALSKTEIGALGTTKVKNGGLLPEVEIYVTSIATLIHSRLPFLVGRGMARVAANEIGRYLDQKNAPLRDSLPEHTTAAHLLARDNRSFRIPMTTVVQERGVTRQ